MAAEFYQSSSYVTIIDKPGIAFYPKAKRERIQILENADSVNECRLPHSQGRLISKFVIGLLISTLSWRYANEHN